MPVQHDARYLEPVEQEALKRLAADAIRKAVPLRGLLKGEEIEHVEREYPRLGEPRGAFATIYVDGELRGCLGEIAPERSLAHVVARCASQATHADYRFDPVRPDDLARLSFKLSVLTPPRAVHSLDDVAVGRDGLVLRYDGRVGVLLPEVAGERQWDANTYLDQLRKKAGIAASVPLEQMRLEAFETQVLQGEL